MKSSSTLKSKKTPPSENPIRVTHRQGDKITILYATSRSGNGEWRVDLEAYRLNGECDCPDFKCHHAKEARRERAMPNSKRKSRRCQHIKAARDWLLNKFLKPLADTTDWVSAPHNTHE